MIEKTTVTVVRTWTYAELFDALGITNGGKAFDDVHITVHPRAQDSIGDNNRGHVTIVTKVES